MPNLTIGRVGLDVDVGDPEKIQESGARQGARQLRFAGALIGATLDETKALRDELLASAELGRVTPVTWTGDASLDGFYRIRSVSVATRSLNDKGFAPFAVDLERIGTAGDLVFRTKLTGTVAANDHGITETESAAFWAPARGAVAVDHGATVPSTVSRTGPSGAVVVFLDVGYTVDPFWTITAAAFYNGAVKVSTGATLRERAGLSVANDPGNWRLDNELVRVTPNATGGRLDVSHHDGTQWETEKVWRIQSGGSDVGAWDAMAVLRNTADEVAVRLTRDVTAGGRYTLDLSLRRGSRFVEGYLTRHAAATLKVVLATAEAGTNITPTGGTGVGAVRKITNDSDRNRYVVGSAKSFVSDFVTGGLSIASTTTLDFFIGSEIAGGGAAAGDTADDLVGQYLGALAADTVALRR